MSPTSSRAWVELRPSQKFLELSRPRSLSGSSATTSRVRALCICSWRILMCSRAMRRLKAVPVRPMARASPTLAPKMWPEVPCGVARCAFLFPGTAFATSYASSPPASAGIPQAVMRCAALAPVCSGRALRPCLIAVMSMATSLFFCPERVLPTRSDNVGRRRNAD